MGVFGIVGDDGNLRIAGIVERFTQQRSVVGKAAVANVLASGNGNLVGIIFSRFKCCQRFADHDLGREADVVMNVAFSQVNCAFSANRKRNGGQALIGKRRRHKLAESVRGIGDQYRFGGGVLLCEFLRIGIREFFSGGAS